jgi:hypothetical protein
VEPNRALRAAREARPSVRVPGIPLGRAELAELVAAHVYRRTGREAPIDAHYVAKLERGVIRWPSAAYRAALAAVLGVEGPDVDATLGFRPQARPTTGAAGQPGVPDPYPDGDGLLALAERAEVSDIGSAAVEARWEEVAELLARAYATTDPAALLVQVRGRAGSSREPLTGGHAAAAPTLVVGGWLGAAGRNPARGPGRPGRGGGRASGGGIAGPGDRPPRDRRMGRRGGRVDGVDRPELGASGTAGSRRRGAGAGGLACGGAARRPVRAGGGSAGRRGRRARRAGPRRGVWQADR